MSFQRSKAEAMLKKTLNNIGNKSDFGLVINWKFHLQHKWVSAFSPYLVEAIIDEFDPIIISSQSGYWFHKDKLNYILSMEPGWAAPKIVYDPDLHCRIGVLVSDPHNKKDWFQRYIEDNNIAFVLSFYERPFFYHFPNFPQGRFRHFPWAVPDPFISDSEITVRNNEVAIFGGKNSDAYDVRNWCREQPGVQEFSLSGVENKEFSDEAYYLWLRKFDAIVAAGSSDPKYDLVTPKYFEIASSGALLVGQSCKDMETLGFDETNSLIFTQGDFLEKVQHFRAHPETFIPVREKGRNLILQQHKLSDRIKYLRKLYYGE